MSIIYRYYKQHRYFSHITATRLGGRLDEPDVLLGGRGHANRKPVVLAGGDYGLSSIKNSSIEPPVSMVLVELERLASL